jgi:uncharacterized protein
MRSLVVGATAGLGRGLAAELAIRKSDLVLVGRDEADLQRVAADLKARHEVSVQVVIADGASPIDLSARLTTALAGAPLDVAMFPIGVSVDDDAVSGDPAGAMELVTVNLLAVITASMVVAEIMRHQEHGVIVGFSSVAAVRGRARNAAYAAAKRGLESWFESLRADLDASGVRVTWYVLGYLDTNLSYGQRLPLPVARVDRVAFSVVSKIDRVRGRQFAPRWWRLVAVAIRGLPFGIFRRLKA